MIAARPTEPTSNLARHEGRSLFSAAEALLKGVFEADARVELVAGPPRASFAGLLALAGDAAIEELLERHGTAVLATPDAARAVTLAAQSAAAGHRAFALVPNEELEAAADALRRAAGTSLERGGAMGVVFEDDPAGCRGSCPRRAAAALDVPCLEPSGVAELRAAMEHALRLSRAVRGPAAIVAHRWVLRSAQTFEARPNRMLDPLAAAAVRPRRTARWAETGGVIRIARRLEVTRMTSPPSPGERLPAGFIVVGPAAEALDHVVHVLRLTGRVPIVRLGLIHPIDDSVIARMLGRCRRVFVLEPRPGSVAPGVLRVAEAMRDRGEDPAVVAAQLGEGDGAAEPRLRSDEALHPSVLARRIVGLLHTIRPGLELPFVPDPPALPAPPPPRGEGLGAGAALAVVRNVLADVDQWLHDQAPPEGQLPATLAIDGAEPADAAGQRVVSVETWPYRPFVQEVVGTLGQAALDDRAWMFVVCAVGAENVYDLERLARAAIPADHAEGARIEVADLNDLPRLRVVLQALSRQSRMSVVIVRDGPPARFDVDALEAERAEIDRFGYEPRQRLVQPTENACAVRARVEPVTRDAPDLKTEFTVGRLARARRPRPAGGGPLRLRVRPRLEEVEVVRDRPPSTARRGAPGGRLEIPRPIHGGRPEWRVHVAGYRGAAPGVAARVLALAGRAMGYDVRILHDPEPIAPGRRAWAQVLFAQPRRDGSPQPVTTRVPYGEADLLLGLDRAETLRAIDPDGSLRVANLDRTCAVVNLGPFADETEPPPLQEGAAVRAVTLDGRRLMEDFAGTARAVFHTDRVTDLLVLGAAFQRGFIPVSHEAVEQAAARIEAKGFGRAGEAVRFGRHLAIDQRLFSKPEVRRDAGAADGVDRSARAALRVLRCGRWARWSGRLDVGRFEGLLHGALAATPGLSETDAGRQARRDLASSMLRCLAWGGLGYAERFAGLVTALYRADRGDTGRALTRCAVLPLAEAMLIRDPIYAGTMVTGPHHRRQIRRSLNVKLARGDRVQRRFLTRIELAAFHRRFRLELLTSDWTAWIVTIARPRIPRRWRGTSVERKIRELVIGAVEGATKGAGENYERWAEILQRLHDQASDDRLRGMALSELRMLIE